MTYCLLKKTFPEHDLVLVVEDWKRKLKLAAKHTRLGVIAVRIFNVLCVIIISLGLLVSLRSVKLEGRNKTVCI